MNTMYFWLLTFLAMALPVAADIEVRISVKFIKNSNGDRPMNSGTDIDISTPLTFDVEITHANKVLEATGRGYQIKVVEYLDIQPPAPVDQFADFWYALAARENRRVFEAFASSNKAVWKWNDNGAINIFVNNTTSGSCSFADSGQTISLGSTLFTKGTVLHEIGHFFNLSHTHGSDANCNVFVPANPLSSGISDGDGLGETIPDHPCYTQDQLSMANFGANYAALSAIQQNIVDDTWLNLMSYHEEDRLLPVQMDYWTDTANRTRRAVCTGYTWFLATNGADGIIFPDGLSPGQAFQSLGWGLARVTGPADVVLLRSGNYLAPQTISTPCTLRATRGPVTLTR